MPNATLSPAQTPAATSTSGALSSRAAPEQRENDAGVDAGMDVEITRIRPPAGWQAINLGEIWRQRELLFFLIWRDVKVRYKQTALGAAWAVLQPLLMMIVFTIFFGRVAGLSSGPYDYSLFAFAGLLPWTFLATGITAAGNSVVYSERLISKVYFPRLIVPFAAAGAALVDFVIAFAMLLAMMLWFGVTPDWGILLAPVIFGVIILAALSVGTLLAALNVAYRDFRYVIPFLVQVWMFATPTVYMQPAANADGLLRALLIFNPMTGLISNFRAACLGGAIDWPQLAVSLVVILAALIVSCLYFRRVEDHFADVI